MMRAVIAWRGQLSPPSRARMKADALVVPFVLIAGAIMMVAYVSGHRLPTWVIVALGAATCAPLITWVLYDLYRNRVRGPVLREVSAMRQST